MKPELSLLWLVLWFVLYIFRLKVKRAEHIFPHSVYFSTWALYWAILYWAFAIYCDFSNKRLPEYNYILLWANPAIPLLIALCYQVYCFLHICFHCPSDKRLKVLTDWAMTTVIMKAIPLFFVLQYLVSWKNSLVSSVLIGFVYFIHKKINNIDITNLYIIPKNFYTAKYSGLGEGGIRGFS
jgi:hypothetical protein